MADVGYIYGHIYAYEYYFRSYRGCTFEALQTHQRAGIRRTDIADQPRTPQSRPDFLSRDRRALAGGAGG